jgi:hypothetical protein
MKIFLAIAISYFSLAHAGTAVSGGGGAFVCRPLENNKTYISKAMLVDLWESQNTPFRWRKPLTPNDKTNLRIIINKTNDISVEQQVSNAINNIAQLNEDLAQATRGELNEILLNLNPLPNGISLTIPNDLQVDYYPDNCPPEGMLRYNGQSKQLDIKTSIFEKLESNTDVAASYIHEALYKVFRQSGSPTAQNNSTLVRRFVACVFSEQCMNLVLNKNRAPSSKLVFNITNQKMKISVSASSDLGSSDQQPIDSPIGPNPLNPKTFECRSNKSLVYVSMHHPTYEFYGSYDIKKIENISFGTKISSRIACNTSDPGVASCSQLFDPVNLDDDVISDGNGNIILKPSAPQSWLRRFDFEPIVLGEMKLFMHSTNSGTILKNISIKNLRSGTNSAYSKLTFGADVDLNCKEVTN